MKDETNRAENAANRNGRKKIVRRRLIGGSVALAVILALILPVVLVREPDLMSQVRRIRGTELEGYAPQQYAWMPDGTMTLVRMGDQHRFDVWRVDPKTGAKTRTGTLDQPLSHKLYSSFWFLSPDGRGLLANEQTKLRANISQYVPFPSGPRQTWPPVPIHMELLRAWLPDGKTWLEGLRQGSGVQFVVHALDGSPPRDAGLLNWKLQYYTNATTSPAGVLIEHGGADAEIHNHKLSLAVLVPTANRWRVDDFTLSAPGMADRMGWAVLSPDGKRIACEFITYLKPNPLLRFLHLVPAVNMNGTQSDRHSLWVGQRDGSGWREIGALPTDAPRGITELAWTPDGKAVSFEGDDGLYTVPAD